MDTEIFKLSKKANKKRLVDFLDEKTEDEIVDLVNSKLNDYHSTNDVDTSLLLRAILQGSPTEGGQSQCIQRRYLVVKCVIQWLSNEEKDIPEKSKQASSVVNLILPEMEILPKSMLRSAGKLITDILAETKPIQLRLLDVFSKIWNVLAATEEMTELSDLFDHLLEANWHSQCIVGIASSLNDMELSKSELEIVLKYMLKKLPDIEVEEVPPFVWQLLLISRKGHKRLVLSGILDYFNKANEEQISRAEGTVMLHISFALKQDQDLGNELVKLIKSNKGSQLELFNVACLLTAARIHRLQDTIFDLFKASIISVYRDNERLERCHWISAYSPLEADKYGQVLLDVTDRSATSGWDQVIQSLTQLSLILIDTAANTGSFFKNDTILKTRSNAAKEDGPMEKVAQLGIDILLRLFKHHDVVRSEILEQITSRIVSRANSAMDFLKLLTTIIKDYPDTVEKYLSNIKDTLDFLSFLPLPTAERLLSAVQPISKTNESFRDGMILVLRKSLFAKDINGREMAVRGFLNILNEQLAEINQEQEQVSAAQGVAFEVLGLLRRCFSQQCEIRTCAYNGLGSLSQEYTSFSGDIFELLYTQFMRSYEKDSSISNPIKLDVCVENANNGGYPKIVEPIHILLANLVKALNAASTENTTSLTSETIVRFKSCMESFIDRLSKASLEDFELDKTANFDMATHLGLRNNLYANLVLGIYEISMEYVHLENGITDESSRLLLTLFKKRKALINNLKDVSTNEKGRKNVTLADHSCVSLCFASGVLESVFPIAKTEQSDAVRDLRSDIDFAQFIVTNTCNSLKLTIDDDYYHRDNDLFDRSVDICRIYMSILNSEDSDSIYANQQSNKKTPSVLASIANSLFSTFELVQHVWPNRFVELVSNILSIEDSDKTKNQTIIDFILQLKEVVFKFLSGRQPIYKEASNVMHLATFLCGKLEKKSPDFNTSCEQVVTWLDEIAKERPIEETTLTRDIIALLIQSSANISEFSIIHKLCRDIHLFTGDLEVPQEETQLEPNVNYQIVNLKTFAVITTKVFEFLDASFDDLTWCIGRLKLCAAAEPTEDNTKKFEMRICKRLSASLGILSELVKSVLTDLHAESLFKTLAKAYKTLHTLVKYKIVYPQDISTDFINVISKSGTDITDKMYKFLTVYGQSQSVDTATHSIKKKGKKKEVNMKQKAKIQRESKMIPNLIFAVEQYERHLIQLSRKSKVDFMQYMKRSTSRDFKIQVDMVQQGNSSDEEESEEEENLKRKRGSRVNTDQDEAGESSKRARVS